MARKMQLRPKLYVQRDLRCNGKRYRKGSVLPWRNEGLRTERVLLLMKTGFLDEEQWPGHPEGKKPLEPELLKIETGKEVQKRLKQEREESDAREQMLHERKLELMGEGRSERDARSQAAGELAGMSAQMELLDDEQDEREERSERGRRQREDRERLEAEEAQRKADEQAQLLEAEEKAKAEAEAAKKAKLEEQPPKEGDEPKGEGEKSESEGEKPKPEELSKEGEE